MKKIRRGMSFVISAFLGLFSGFVSCVSTSVAVYMGPPPTPNMFGKVVDSATDEAIAGIRIELLKNGTNIASATTSSVGKYSLYTEKGNFEIRVTDVDGVKNGEYNGITNQLALTTRVKKDYKLKKNK